MKQINSPGAPKAIGPYSQAIKAGNLLFVSGQVPVDPNTGSIPEGIQAQTRQALTNIKAIVEEAGLSLSYIAKCEVYMKDLNDFKAMNEVYAEFFADDPKPARQAMQVARLPLDVDIEISCIAVVPK